MTFIYKKVGRRTSEEARMEESLADFFQSNPDKSPNEPVTTVQELKTLHEKYVFDNIEVLATEINEPKETSRNISDDPMNRQNPKVRNYVLENNSADSTQTDFQEPVNFDDAFHIPDPSDETITSEPAAKAVLDKKSSKADKKEKEGPIFNEDENMSSAKVKKKTKVFAKAIVKITCDLAEYGIIWFGTKDITDEKLEAIQTETGVDLSLLLELDKGQKVTIRDFLIQTRLTIIENAKIDEEDREELADALCEVLLEEGIQPTPKQNLILVCAKIFLPKGLSTFTQVKVVSSVLAQIRAVGIENSNAHAQDMYEQEYATNNSDKDTDDVAFPPIKEEAEIE